MSANQINDQAARKQALEPAQSFIVQAPAGSGKTGLLVYRFLRALTTVKRPEQVLAITFTRKATSEMRERLMELLIDASNNKQSEDAFEQQGINLARAVLDCDEANGWKLLDAPDQLQIYTIDGFCSRLSGDMPWLSRLGDRPSTVDDASKQYGAAVDSLLQSLLQDSAQDQQDEAYQALVTVLTELDFNYKRARDLFIGMLAKRDQWLRHLVQSDLSNERRALETAWEELVDDGVETLEQTFSQDVLNFVIQHANQAAQLIPANKTPLAAFLAQPLSAGQRLTLAHWRDIQHLLTTASAAGIRKQVDKNTGFPVDNAENKARKVEFTELLSELQEDEHLLAALQNLNSLPNGSFSDIDWQQLDALKTVLLRLAALLQLEFGRSSECDHSEIAQRALMALEDLGSPSDLALRMDYQLQHILVDEFQDTSRSQLRLLQSLTAGWQYDDGRSLFLVGDPMQSIYRFREADVSLFLQVANNQQTHVFDNLQIHALQLSENFRSSKGLVDWFNSTFQQSFPQRDDVLTGAITYAQASSNKNKDSEIVCELAHDAEQEAQRVVEIVRDHLQHLQHKQNPDDKIAVLVRNRSHLTQIIKQLDQHQIAYSGVDIKPLSEVGAVQDLVTLCKAICRPTHRLAWLALLRSPLLGLTLGELLKVTGDNVWQNLNEAQLESQAGLQRFIPIMQQAMEQRQRLGLHAVVRWAWQALGGEQLQSDISAADIERVFEIIQQLEQGGDLLSLQALDDAISGLYAQPSTAGDPRVVLSTMHKSKGLQYHTVILPGLDRRPRNEDKQVLMWAERGTQNGATDLLLAPIRLRDDAGEHFAYLRTLESKRAQVEMVRLMYVACTRAERKLVLLGRCNYDDDGQLRAPIKSSLMSTVWEALTFIEPTEAAQEAEDAQLDQRISRLPADFVPSFPSNINWQAKPMPEPKDQSLEYEWATELATGVGTVLHNWLENNAHLLSGFEVDDQQRQRWLAELRALRVPEHQLSAGIQRLQSGIKNMQADPHAEFVFADHVEASNELSLTTFENGEFSTYKLDRTFVDQDNVRWIVDYKTTTTQQTDIDHFIDEQVSERHKPQLENYGRLMQQIDNRPIMLAVYFPMLSQLRSWPYNQ